MMQIDYVYYNGIIIIIVVVIMLQLSISFRNNIQ